MTTKAPKKRKPKKPLPVVLQDPPPAWNLGRGARWTDTPTPEFLKHLIVKRKGE